MQRRKLRRFIIDTWTDFFRGLFVKLSPKVVLPFAFVQVSNLIYAIGEGGWDWRQTLIAVLAFAAAALGFAAPPAPNVRFDEVAALSEDKHSKLKLEEKVLKR